MQNTSLYRIKQLIQWQNASSAPIWKTLLIILIGAVALALFFIWIDFDYTLIIYVLYPVCSFSFLSLNFGQGERKTLDYLILPASSGEKLLAILIISTLVPTILIALTIPMIVLIQGIINYIAEQNFLAYMPVLDILKPKIFLIGLFVQSLLSFLYLSFKKRALLYTILTTFIGICIVQFFKIVVESFIAYDFPYYQAYIHYGELFGNNLSGIISVISNGILICMTILFWIVSYYKLREREI